MKPPPPNWPRISSALFYANPAEAIDWLCAAFGFKVRLKVESEPGFIEHSELELGEPESGQGLIMVAGAGGRYADRHPADSWKRCYAGPAAVGGVNTQSLAVYVEDVDSHCEHSRQQGARIVCEPATTDYGEDYWADRNYCAIDPEGHVWWFMQRLRTGGAA